MRYEPTPAEAQLVLDRSRPHQIECGQQLPKVLHYLVPTKFGRTSKIARAAAVDWAKQRGGKVTLLHVLPPAPAPTASLDAIGMMHEHVLHRTTDDELSRIELERLEEQLRPEASRRVEIRSEVRQGELDVEIAQFAAEHGVDAIVFGARRWGVPWTNSTARRIAGQVSCQVVLVYEPAQTPDTAPPEAGNLGSRFRDRLMNLLASIAPVPRLERE